MILRFNLAQRFYLRSLEQTPLDTSFFRVGDQYAECEKQQEGLDAFRFFFERQQLIFL